MQPFQFLYKQPFSLFSDNILLGMNTSSDVLKKKMLQLLLLFSRPVPGITLRNSFLPFSFFMRSTSYTLVYPCFTSETTVCFQWNAYGTKASHKQKFSDVLLYYLSLQPAHFPRLSRRNYPGRLFHSNQCYCFMTIKKLGPILNA